jgi:hypothetical protein
MAEILLQKQGVIWVPGDEDAIDITHSVPNGKYARMKYVFPRNIKNHKRFFAFLNLAFDAQEFFKNIHHFRKWLIGKAGYFTIIQTPKGGTIFDADSIAFDKMDEISFRKVFNDCVQAFIDEFGPKVTQKQIDEIVMF